MTGKQIAILALAAGGLYYLHQQGQQQHAVLAGGGVTTLPPQRRVSPCPPLGDINGDGWVDEADKKLALQIVAGLVQATQAQLVAADVNGDGQVSAVDALIIERYYTGLANTFPACAQAPIY